MTRCRGEQAFAAMLLVGGGEDIAQIGFQRQA